MRIPQHLFSLAASVLVASAAANALAQAPLAIYTDHLVNAFQDWSWAPHALNNPAPVHSGNRSISVNGTAWQALSFYHAGFDTTPYASVSFWAHGGASGGQVLQVYATANGVDQPAAAPFAPLTANAWQRFDVPLAALNADSQTNVSRLYIQLTASGSTATFYVDDIQLMAKPAPTMVHLSVNATQAVRQVDFRWFGVNTAIWDSNFDTPTTVALLQEMGARFLRCPGGSLSDEYHWETDKSLNNTWRWVTSFAEFVHVATNVGVQAVITVNYGTGTTNEAAAWVAYANGATNNPLPLGVDKFGTNWQTVGYWASLRAASPLAPDDGRNFLRISRAAPFGFKYWEIGNECYGTWETDSNAVPHDPWTYATRARDYLNLMKAVDSTIRIGVVAAPGEGSYNNNANHFAVNPRTGTTNYGWTPIMLATLKSLKATPDFAIHHYYAQYTDSSNPVGTDSDPLLLQCSTHWAQDAADLRQQLTDYLGTAGTNVELVCTENNSDSGAQGKQSTSLVNGVYYADSLSQLMKTEFNGLVWWDLRNGTDTGGNFDPSLYGWRTIGDLGMVNGLNTRFPTFYAAKLMHEFAQPGDTILDSASDYLLLSAYGARSTNGVVSLLVLNKDTTTNFNAQMALPGFTPQAAVTMRSYGMPQDNAAQSGVGSQDIAQINFTIASANFSGSFPPLSLTLLTLTPERLAVEPASQTVVAGSTTAFTAKITSVSWLTNSVTLSVTGLPAGVSAAFSPPSVSGSGSSTLSVTPGYVTPGTYPLTVVASGDGLTNTASVTLIISLGIIAWGNDSFGQSTMPGAVSNAIILSAGGYHNLALRADGSVFAWGDDLNGQCDIPPGLTNVVAIAAGRYHSLALRADGSVVAWGDNSSGQTDVPGSATNVVAISAGGWHSLALRGDGTVIAWGDNSLHQSDVPADLAGVVAIAAGGHHSLALRSDGTVAAWGSNSDPYGEHSGQVDVPTGLSQVVALAAGGYHSLALRGDGTVVGWGYNGQGQATVPAGLAGVMGIAAGEAHSLALRADGTVVAWGDNSYGQCTVGPAVPSATAISAGSFHSLELIAPRPPAPQVFNPLRHGSTFTFSVRTARGRTYFPQYKDSLTDTNWIWPSIIIVGDGSVKTLTDPAATAPHRSYRVRQQ